MSRNLTRLNPLALAIAMISPTAIAADFAIEEVVVTAQKREQSLQDVPLSVQALGADQLKQNSVNSISDISSLTPGLSIGGSQQSGGLAEVSVRGISTLTLSNGLDASTPTYLDGIFLPQPFILRELSDIERIEVLRGPQGTLFGRNAAAGAISVTTVAPTDEFEGSVELGYGSDDLFTLRGVVNVPLSDSLRLRVSGTGRNRDGSIRSEGGSSDFLSQDHVAIRSRLAWDASDRVSVDFSGDFLKQNDTAIANTITRSLGSPLFGFDIGPQADLSDETLPAPANADGTPFDSDFNVESWGVGARVNIELNDNLSLTSLTSYRKDEVFDLASNSEGILIPGLPRISAVAFELHNDIESFNQEFRLNGSSDLIDWFVGLNYYYAEGRQLDVITSAPLGVGTAGDRYRADIEN